MQYISLDSLQLNIFPTCSSVIFFVNNYGKYALQLWNTNEQEDLQVLVIVSRPPVKVYVSVTSIPILFLFHTLLTNKVIVVR